MATLGDAMSRGMAIAGMAMSGMAMVGGADTFLVPFCVGIEGGTRIRGIGVLSARTVPGNVGPAISGVGNTGEGILGLLSGRPFMTAVGN